MFIRLATVEDAEQGLATLRASNSELCSLDHANDPQQISDWLENKTVQSWMDWAKNPKAKLYVADSEGQILGVSMIQNSGHILLNYVHPDARFSGVSSSFLSQMEANAREMGRTHCTLNSTKTARPFYLKHGYLPLHGGECVTLSKLLRHSR